MPPGIWPRPPFLLLSLNPNHKQPLTSQVHLSLLTLPSRTCCMPDFPIVDNFNFWLKCHFPREAFRGHPKSPALLRYHLKVGFFPPSLWSSPAENCCDLFSFLLVRLFIGSPPACDLDLSFSDFLCCSPMPDTQSGSEAAPK